MLFCAGLPVKALAQGLSNRGKEFWVGYGLHQFMEQPGATNAQEMVLYFSAEEAATVTVTIKGRTATLVKEYKVPANTVIVSDRMPKNGGPTDCRLYDYSPSFGGTGGDGLFHVSIHIESDVPIVAYAHIYGVASSGATMLMPVASWGYSYISLNSKQEYAANCFSFAYLVAYHDSTVVEIRPSVLTRDGHPAGVTFNVTMQKGDIYQVVGANIDAERGYELTGTTVKSVANVAGDCYTVGFFSGSSRTANPCSAGSAGGDNDMQQCFPYEAWGKRYYTAPTSSSNAATSFMKNMYKVVVKDDATVVKRNGQQLSNYDAASKSYYFESNTADYIEADKAVVLAQFISGGCLGAGPDGDPEMMYLSSVEQGIKRTGFYRNTEEGINVNYLTLIIHKSGLPSLQIDGSKTFSHVYTHPQNADYRVVVNRWLSAKSQCIVSSDSAFTAVTYGLGFRESYGYNAGTMINNLNALLRIHNVEDTAQSHVYTCTGTPVNLSVLMAYTPDRLEWLLSQVTGIHPAVDIDQVNPVPSGTVFYNGITYFKYELPGIYTFDTTGIWDVPIRSSDPAIDNCRHAELFLTSVTVKGPPFPVVNIQHTGCMADSVYFKGGAASADVSIARWKWGFDDGTTDDTVAVAKLYKSKGAHDVTVKVVSSVGCVADTLVKVTVDTLPVVKVAVADTSVCAGEPVVMHGAVQGGGSVAVKNWYWNMGNGTTATGEKPDAVMYSRSGTYIVKLQGSASDACRSDTATQLIVVHAAPDLSFNWPDTCLGKEGIVKFINHTTVSGGELIAAHAWNFGDAQATAANPDTADVASPEHSYTKYEKYKIYYKATTENGCMADTTAEAVFKIKPQFTFQALPAVCERTDAAVSVAKAVVVNGVPGTGIYKGPGVSAQGDFNAVLAGAGLHKVWYVFTTASGCIDSVAAAIEVYPSPHASFTAPEEVCAGAVFSISDQSAISSGAIASLNWQLGDGSTTTNAAAAVFDKKYRTPGDYTITLTAKSEKGCFSADTSVQVHVRPLPVAGFEAPAVICMPGGRALFTNTTTVADGTPVTYVWHFSDDNSSSSTISPEHTYAAAGTYTVTLKASSALGCADSTSATVSGFYSQPVAAFTVAPETVCQGSGNQFTDASTAAGSTITAWSWSFGDGTRTATRNAEKQYAVAGPFTATLVVTSAEGCVSDTARRAITVYVQPRIDAGPSFTVNEGEAVVFQPAVNDSLQVTFLWSPATLLNNPALLRPTYIAADDQVFTLTATGKEGGCKASDQLSVTVLKPVIIPNAFTPNGDGVHDTWNVTHLSLYPGCTVNVFNRYGQSVYSAVGYAVPWNGVSNGNPLPAGTYYYIIDFKNGSPRQTGAVTIIR